MTARRHSVTVTQKQHDAFVRCEPYLPLDCSQSQRPYIPDLPPFSSYATAFKMDIDTCASSPASVTVERLTNPSLAVLEAGNLTSPTGPPGLTKPSDSSASPQLGSRNPTEVAHSLSALAELAVTGETNLAVSPRQLGLPPTPPSPSPPVASAPSHVAPSSTPSGPTLPTAVPVHKCCSCARSLPFVTQSQPLGTISGSPTLSISALPSISPTVRPSILSTSRSTPRSPRSASTPPPVARGPAQSGDVELEHLRRWVAELEAISARLHGQLETSQQRLFKERAHHETISEMWATRVEVLERECQRLKIRLGLFMEEPREFVPFADTGEETEAGLSFAPNGYLGRQTGTYGKSGKIKDTPEEKEKEKRRLSSPSPRRPLKHELMQVDQPMLLRTARAGSPMPKLRDQATSPARR